jgi:hypothetical protein
MAVANTAVACWGNEICQGVAITAGVIGCSAATGAAFACAAGGAALASLDNVSPCAHGSGSDCGAIAFEAAMVYVGARGGVSIGAAERSGSELISETAQREASKGPKYLGGFLSDAEWDAYARSPARGSRFLGQAVHRATAQSLENQYPGRFRYFTRGPDFLETGGGSSS